MDVARSDQRLGIAAAAKAAGVHPSRLYVAFARGHLEAVRQGERLYFLPEDIRQFRVSLIVKKAADEQNAALQRRRANAALSRARARTS